MPTFRQYAAIDLGSNAARLLISNVKNDAPIFNRKPHNAGRESYAHGVISEASIRELVTIFREFSEQIDGARLPPTVAVATAAFRNASNGEQVLATIESETGIPVRIINGDEEAELSWRALQLATRSPKANHSNTGKLSIDLGGGSTEVCIGNSQLIDHVSLALGSSQKSLDFVQAEAALSLIAAEYDEHQSYLVGGSGTILLACAKHLALVDNSIKTMSIAVVQQLQNKIVALARANKLAELPIGPDRIDTIEQAIDITLWIMRTVGIQRVTPAQAGLVNGIIAQLQTSAAD